ncbi:MAG: hypothetical protein EOP23_23270, partial [Hyphomicrobiales bacterium]
MQARRALAARPACAFRRARDAVERDRNRPALAAPGDDRDGDGAGPRYRRRRRARHRHPAGGISGAQPVAAPLRAGEPAGAEARARAALHHLV